MKCVKQVGGKPTFHDKTLGPRRLGGAHIVGVVMHRQKNDLSRKTYRPEAPGGREAVEHRHRDVEHKEVRVEAGRLIDHRLTVADLHDDLKCRFEQLRNDGTELVVVISQ